MLSLAALLFACPQPQEQAAAPVPGELAGAATDAVATVNGNEVPGEFVDLMKERIPPQMKAQMQAMGDSVFVNQLVDIELLYRDAVDRKLHESADHKASVAFATRQALADAALVTAVDERTTDEAMKKYYEDHLVQYAQTQRLIKHIVVEDEASAEKVLAEIDGGKPFEAAAAEHSMDPNSKDLGGEIGWFAEKDLRGPLGEAAFSAEIGKPTKVKAQFHHIILAAEERDKAPFEDVKDQIKEEMKRELSTKYIEELRAAATIETDAPAPVADPDAPVPGAVGGAE